MDDVISEAASFYLPITPSSSSEAKISYENIGMIKYHYKFKLNVYRCLEKSYHIFKILISSSNSKTIPNHHKFSNKV